MLDRPGGAEVLLPLFEIAGGIVFVIRLIPSEAVFADAIGSGMEIGDEDAGVVARSPADDLGAGEGVHSSEAGAVGQGTVDPARLQSHVVACGEFRSGDPNYN
jgi:hypothetical protein